MNEELKDEIGENKSKIEDIVNKFDNIGMILGDFNIKSKFWTFFDDLSYPYGLDLFLKKYIVPKLQNPHFIGTLKDSRKDFGHSFQLKQNFQAEDISLISRKIQSGLEYFQISKKSSNFIKPVLLFYSVNQIYSSIIDMFGDFSITKSHGLFHQNTDPYEVDFSTGGFFRKLGYFIYLYNMKDNPFNKIAQKRVIKFSRSNIFGKSSSFILKKEKCNLRKLNEYVSSSPHISEQLNFMVNYLNLFCFSSLARYRPSFWTEFLEGKDFMYKIYLESQKDILKNINFMLKKITISSYRHLFDIDVSIF